jgi:hypothetical protein
VKVLWDERPLFDAGNVDALVEGVPDVPPPEVMREAVDVPPQEEEGIADDPAPALRAAAMELSPRTYQTFYGTILAKERVWQRPPEDHCTRCADFKVKTARHLELTRAVSIIEGDPSWEWASAILTAAGGTQAAHEEARRLAVQLPDLKKHVTWRARQRAYLKRRERALPITHQLWQLDYGGLTDSRGRKVSVWSATVIRPAGEQENIDFFFDSANQGGAGEGAAKKDGQTGIYFLHELFDPLRSPAGPDGRRTSMVQRMFPEVKHVILSGDTGNGYRAYAMLDELSRLKGTAGITFELIPLAPGHAFNRSDARIAHQNTFLRGLKRRSRVFGAKDIATAFHTASNPATANRRKHLTRSQCFFRKVVVDRAAADLTKKQFGAQLIRADLDKGHMGVRGFLFFDFSHGDGYATVREHGDPAMLDNPSMIYTWRKDLSKAMCQQCSDRLQRPTLLTHGGCTKRRCAFRANAPAAAPRLPMVHAVQPMPAAAAPAPAPPAVAEAIAAPAEDAHHVNEADKQDAPGDGPPLEADEDEWDAVMEALHDAPKAARSSSSDDDNESAGADSPNLDADLQRFTVVPGDVGPNPPAVPFYIVDFEAKQYLGRPPGTDVCIGPYTRCWRDPKDGKEIQHVKRPRHAVPLQATYLESDIVCPVQLDRNGTITPDSVHRIVHAFEREDKRLEALLPSWARETAAVSEPSAQAPAVAPRKRKKQGSADGKRERPEREAPASKGAEASEAFYLANTASVDKTNVLSHKRRRTQK